MTDPTKIHETLIAANVEYTAYSCDGINLFGDQKSIDAAMSAFHSHGQIDDLKTNLRHWREECGKLHAELAAERADHEAAIKGFDEHMREVLGHGY